MALPGKRHERKVMITLRNARVAWQRNYSPLFPCPIDDYLRVPEKKLPGSSRRSLLKKRGDGKI
jgi:hypothetical protein